MTRHSTRLSRSIVSAMALTTTAALLIPAAASAAPARGEDATTPARATAPRSVPGAIPSAEAALRRAQALFADPQATTRSTLRAPVRRNVDGRGATMVLRDLAARLPELSGSQRAAAAIVLARPTQPSRACSTLVSLCVHWATSGNDAPNLTDTDLNSVPDWVDTTLATMETVYQSEVGTLGYRAPRADTASAKNGGGAELDVYLSNIGSNGLYGYCTSDDPKLAQPVSPATSAVSAFCVLDNDYSPTEFPALSPTENLQVTAAHEFFHAVQFSYDFFEDRWLMESTAAWVEDVVYNDVNDNRQFLKAGPLQHPLAPLDKGKGGAQYGSWLFFKYLSEKYGDLVVRRIWERADDSTLQQSTNDLKTYSLPAIGKALAARGTSLRAQFSDFAAANTTPAAFYLEGVDYIPVTPQSFPVRPAKPATPLLSARLSHLASLPAVIQAAGGTPADARLRVTVDGPGRATRPQARLVVRYDDGHAVLRRISLNAKGNGKLTVPFGAGTVTSVVVVLANGSDRYRQCFSGNPFGGLSCWSGKPVDNGKPYRFQARLV